MAKVGEQIQFDGVFLNGAGVPVSGLVDVVITVYSHSGSAIVSGAACSEISSSGVYRYTLSGGSVTGIGNYSAVMSSSSLSVHNKILISESVESASSGAPSASDIADAVWDEPMGHTTAGTAGKLLSDAGASGDPLTNAVPGAYASGTAGAALGNITNTSTVTIVDPLSDDGETLTLIIGDDYQATDSRALDWSSTTWPVLTGATITLEIGTAFSFAGSVVTGTGTTKTVRVQLTDTQTLTLKRGKQSYAVKAVLSNADVITLVRGDASIEKRAG